MLGLGAVTVVFCLAFLAAGLRYLKNLDERGMN